MTKTIKRKDFLKIVREVCDGSYPELIESAKRQTSTCYEYAGDNNSYCLVGQHLIGVTVGLCHIQDRIKLLSLAAEARGLVSVGECFSEALQDHLGDIDMHEEVLITKKFTVLHVGTGKKYKVRLPMTASNKEIAVAYLKLQHPAGFVHIRGQSIDCRYPLKD